MKTSNQSNLLKVIFPATAFITLISTMIILQGCEKTLDKSRKDQDITAQTERRRPTNPPPPAPLFYFTNCHNPVITGNIVAGTATNATFTLQYINGPGGAYPAYTSSTVNGITLKAPAGTLNSGNGSITFTASGTALTPGSITIPVSIKGSIACNLSITVLNPPPSPGNCTEPGIAVGSTGCVTFTYRGQQVTYTTVRAADGKVWLKQNMGSPQVAVIMKDAASYGHYFQWGRWDDGHQATTSSAITGSTSLQNPSHIASGNANFIKGTTATTSWWGTGGAATNTWSGTTVSATNGKDPCTAIGQGWHLPSSTDWRNVMNAEFISDNISAFESNLRLPESGYRASGNGVVYPDFVGGFYWSSTGAANNTANRLFFDAAYNADIRPGERGYGFNCRCVKN